MPPPPGWNPAAAALVRMTQLSRAVYIEGLHMCMAARGVGAHEARLVTSGVRGVFLTHASTREEFIKLVTAPQNTVL